jgi:hypothetical protein
MIVINRSTLTFTVGFSIDSFHWAEYFRVFVSRSVSEDILWRSKVHHRAHKTLSIPSHNFLKIHFSIAFERLCTSNSLFRFLGQNLYSLHFSVSRVCYASCPSRPRWFDLKCWSFCSVVWAACRGSLLRWFRCGSHVQPNVVPMFKDGWFKLASKLFHTKFGQIRERILLIITFK